MWEEPRLEIPDLFLTDINSTSFSQQVWDCVGLADNRVTTNSVSVNDSCQPRVGQSTLVAKHLHLQPEDFQGELFLVLWFYEIRLKILRYGRYEYPPLHLYLDPVEFLEIDCQNYFINRKILFYELNKIFLLWKYKICQYVYWTIFVLGRRGIQLLQEIEKKYSHE